MNDQKRHGGKAKEDKEKGHVAISDSKGPTLLDKMIIHRHLTFRKSL